MSSGRAVINTPSAVPMIIPAANATQMDGRAAIKLVIVSYIELSLGYGGYGLDGLAQGYCPF